MKNMTKLTLRMLLLFATVCAGTHTPAAGAVDYPSIVTAVAFSPDRKLFALGAQDKMVAIMDAQTNRRVHTLVGHTGFVASLAFSPDGKILASGSEQEGDAIKFWDVATGKELRTLQDSSKGNAKGAGRTFMRAVTSLAFSPDGKTLASAGASVMYPYDEPARIDPVRKGEIKLWEVATGKLLRTMVAGETLLMAVAFSPDGKMVVSGTNDVADRSQRGLKVWDAATGKELRVLPDKVTNGNPNSISVSPDGKYVAASHGRWVRVHDFQSGQALHEIDGGGILTFSPDSKILAIGESDIVLWDVSTGAKLQQLAGFPNGPNGVAFTDDGKTLITGGWNGNIKHWDVGSGRAR
jgi:WD40 repeat protein